MSLLDFYSELFPGSLVTWMIGSAVLLVIVFFVESFFEESSSFTKIIWVILLWFLSPVVIWIISLQLTQETILLL